MPQIKKSLQFFNIGPDEPARRSKVFGPYDEVLIKPNKITVQNTGTSPFDIGLRDSDKHWYCDADGDLYSGVLVGFMTIDEEVATEQGKACAR